MVSTHDGHSSSLLRTSHCGADVLAEDISGAPESNAAIEPAITPVQQTKTVDVPSVPRSFNQTVSPSSFV